MVREEVAMRRLVWVALLAGCGGSGGGAGRGDAAPVPADGAVDAATADAATDGTPADAAPADAALADAALADAGACPAGSADAPGAVATAQGVVQGVASGDTWAWLGVPFAAPPVGELRWRPPAPPACHDALLADHFAPPCPQLDATGAHVGQEDCLYLNVWRPSAPADGPRPVLFFVHGGGNSQGSTSEEVLGHTRLYDGAALAARTDAIVVTTAYRLGYLGFLAHPALADADGRAGNYGALDQIAALRWVRDNVAAFGGDPARVLLFGESAGGRDTCVLLASPLAAGLFSAALIESGGCSVPARDAVEAESAELADALGCAGDVAACLRAADPFAMLDARPLKVEVAGKSDSLQPFVDGHLLTEQPIDAMAAGRANAVPTVIGANAEETGQAVPAQLTEAEYGATVRALFGPLADRVLAQYPVASYPDARHALIRLTTDAKFVCPSRAAARAQAGHAPTWRYFFTQHLDNVRRESFAFHGLELFFVFDHLDAGGYRPSAAETTLADRMGRAWGALAAAGDPALADVAWPRYEAARDDALVLDGAGLHEEDGIRADDCDFWDGIAALIGG
jgi:para-nitrobenzyl esterase